ncbi:hypothetical protein RhiirA1_458057 [Rhizophagus irregularis]|uniref:DUF659 domain-containing protein n=1 Tax=Rhizophagus irregularis TaxID=588596 RepID=A0A2N0RWN6_9GLOM|nr:hypothetical protein RhiirA1_458057 [Rhizophagus irregularis]
MCRFCDHSINFQTKNTITALIGSKTHILDAFVTADIPLEKIDKLQNWLRENCNEGGFIPKSDTLRRDYLPKLFEDHVNQLIKEYFRGRQVLIIIDETTDKNVNNCTIGQLLIQTLVQWGISFDLPQLIASDSATYMKKCYRDVFLREAWVSINYFQVVHQLLANIKQTFVYSRSRKQFVADLDFFQQENKPMFPFIEQRLQQLEARITMGKTMTNVGSTMDLVLQKFNSPLTAFCPVFQQAAYKRLEDHVLQHPARSLFRAVQVFDPRFLSLTTANRDIYSYKIIRELANPSTFLIQEWSIYVNINLNLIEFSELNEF